MAGVKQVLLAQVRRTLTPHHRNSEKFHFRAAQKIKENQAKIANLILKKYEEIGKIPAGMIFKGLNN